MIGNPLPGTILQPKYVIVIGASAGGVAVLLELVQDLAPALDAAIGIVLHVGNRHSVLPELLAAKGRWPVAHAKDGEPLKAGRMYVAPPDHHMLFTTDTVRLSRGPRENHARPAIDPLFRSAAITWRRRAIGVVLTGDLDDGTAGLGAIKDAGGIAIVQDPHTAFQPSMPATALANVQVDHCVPVTALPPLLEELVGRMPPAEGAPPPERLLRENAIFEGNLTLDQTLDNMAAVAQPSTLTCPECGGGLWELKDTKPLRFRCHTGHGYSAATLQDAQAELAEQALWSSVRALQEREMLLRRLAAVAEATGDPAQAEAGRHQADRVRAQVIELSRLVESEPGRDGLPAPNRKVSGA